MILWRITGIAVAIMLFAGTSPADVQKNDAALNRPGRGILSRIGLKADIGTEVVYSDNIYHLTEFQITSLEEGVQEDADSGRFNDMPSARDVVITPWFQLNSGLHSPLGGKINLKSRLYYHAYSENTAKNYPEVSAKIKQTIGKNDDITLRLTYVNDFFKKNYLINVDDSNNNGNIPKEERIYSPAVYDEFETLFIYGHNVVKENKQRISRIDIEPFGGFCSRIYNSGFHNRDRWILFGGVGVHVTFLSIVAIKTTYEFQDVDSPGNLELVLFDETIGETDVNDDGEIKENAPFVTRIDRSCHRHSLSIMPCIDVTDHCEVFFGYEWRKSIYSSQNPLDVAYYRQTAIRDQMEAGIKYKVSKKWTAEAAVKRTDDDSEDEDDYTENSAAFRVIYNFH